MFILPHILPQPALRPYVRHYLVLHMNMRDVPEQQRIKPIPPDAEQSLFFYPRSQVKTIVNSNGETRINASSIFVGQQTSRINILFGEDHLIIQVCFRPGFLYQFLNRMPITTFQDKEMSAEDLGGKTIRELNEQLQEETNYYRMIALIETYLLKKIARTTPEISPIDKVIMAIKDGQQPHSLDWLADQACLSGRQLERKFLERVGMSPKFYARIVRFQKAFQLKIHQPQLNWLDVAYLCDYFDYSHMMRDFRQFADVVPSILMAQETASPDWWV